MYKLGSFTSRANFANLDRKSTSKLYCALILGGMFNHGISVTLVVGLVRETT